MKQAERDNWIQQELKQLNKQIKDKEDHQRKISEDLKKDEEKRATLEKKIKDHEQEMEKQKTSVDNHNKEYYDLNKLKDQSQATRKEQSVLLLRT